MPKFILDGKEYGGGSGNGEVVELTQSEYDALVESNNIKENVSYYITDASGFDASLVEFDNNNTNLNAATVQDAIVEQNKKMLTVVSFDVTTGTLVTNSLTE